MSLEKRTPLNHQISEEAAEWLIEFRTDDIDGVGRRDFDVWIRSSPEHLRAFIEMAALWNESGAVDAQRRLDVEAIIARARGEANVIGLRSDSPYPADRVPSSLHERESQSSGLVKTALGRKVKGAGLARVSKLALAAGVVAAAVGSALILRLRFFGPPTFSTEVGEQRSIRLADGSIVVLDSRSQLRVAFTPAARKVELLNGQALFDVVKNPLRPFIVLAGGTVVRDVGTQFDVNRGADGTIVTVVEGRVSVSQSTDDRVEWAQQASAPAPGRAKLRSDDGSQGHEPIFLSAGEQVDIPIGGFSPQPIQVNVSSVMAWTHRRVVLNSATLAQVAEVFNRYSTRKLVTEDHGAKPLRLSGVFTTDPAFLIRYLRARPDITVSETDSEVDIVRNHTP